MASIKEILLDGGNCIEMKAGGYLAILAPEIGNNMIRMRNEDKKVEVFHINEEKPFQTVKENPEVYGYPFLYLPNRLDHGRVVTSDGVYYLPVNEEGPFYNSLHGFLHKRPYQVISQEIVDEDTVRVVSQYVYDENDDYFQYYPIAFTCKMTYTLSKDGLVQDVVMTNHSEKMMPVGVCSHTPFNAPFVEGTDEKDYVLCVPAVERWEITNRCLPTEHRFPLTEYDERYVKGTMPCVGRNLDNDLYTAGMNTLDGNDFYGVYMTHKPSGCKICYEVSPEYKFWVVWNDRGDKNYFCPEPVSWMIDAPNLKLPSDVTGYTEIPSKHTYTCQQHIFVQ